MMGQHCVSTRALRRCCRVNRSLRGRTDDEDRAGRIFDEVLADRRREDSFPEAPIVRADDNEITVVFFGCVDDRAACMADVGVKIDVGVDGSCGTCR
jgi:hypothetical protein